MNILIKSYYGIDPKYSASQKRVSDYILRILELGEDVWLDSFEDNPTFGSEWTKNLASNHPNLHLVDSNTTPNLQSIFVIILTDLWLDRTLKAGYEYILNVMRNFTHIKFVYDAVDCIAKTQSGYASDEIIKVISYYESELHKLSIISVFVNEVERNEVVKRYGVNVEKCCTLSISYKTIDEVAVKPLEKRNNFCFVGGSSPSTYDSLNIILNIILPKLKLRLDNFSIDLIGSAFTHKQIYESLANIAGIKIIGPVESIPEIIQNYFALVVPFKTSIGVRGRILESMSCGTPVITTSSGCVGMEIAMHEEILVADHVDTFVDCMMIAKLDEHRWKDVSNRALRYMSSKYSNDVVNTQLNILLNKLNQFKL